MFKLACGYDVISCASVRMTCSTCVRINLGLKMPETDRLVSSLTMQTSLLAQPGSGP